MPLDWRLLCRLGISFRVNGQESSGMLNWHWNRSKPRDMLDDKKMLKDSKKQQKYGNKASEVDVSRRQIRREQSICCQTESLNHNRPLEVRSGWEGSCRTASTLQHQTQRIRYSENGQEERPPHGPGSANVFNVLACYRRSACPGRWFCSILAASRSKPMPANIGISFPKRQESFVESDTISKLEVVSRGEE